MSHAYHHMCGCAACCRHERNEERREESIDALVADWNRGDDAKRREAEEWTAGSFEGEHYSEVTLALDELHRLGATPAVIEKLHRLAKVESAALQEKLREMAEAEIDRGMAA